MAGSSSLINPFDIIVHDIETNGLRHELDRIHCASAICMLTGEVAAFRPHEISEYVRLCRSAKVFVGHNIINFDNPVIDDLWTLRWTPDQCWDTLVVSRVFFPDRPQGHSLKSWGEKLGVIKGTYGETTDWSEFTEDMLEYNIQDNRVAKVLAEHQMKHAGVSLEELLEMGQWLKLG